MRKLIKVATSCSFFVFVLVCLFTLTSCKEKDKGSDMFYIYNLGVDIAADYSNITRFVGFGDYADGMPSHCFRFALSQTTNIYSPVNGTIESVRQQQGGDGEYDVFIIPDGVRKCRNRNSPLYILHIDHFDNPTVTTGQRVTAGQFIGTDGTHPRLEFVISNDEEKCDYAPMKFMHTDSLAEYTVRINGMIDSLVPENSSPTSFIALSGRTQIYAGCWGQEKYSNKDSDIAAEVAYANSLLGP